jgi:hypothetical protein
MARQATATVYVVGPYVNDETGEHEFAIQFPTGEVEHAPTKAAVKRAVVEYKRLRGWGDRIDGRMAIEWEDEAGPVTVHVPTGDDEDWCKDCRRPAAQCSCLIGGA